MDPIIWSGKRTEGRDRLVRSTIAALVAVVVPLVSRPRRGWFGVSSKSSSDEAAEG